MEREGVFRVERREHDSEDGGDCWLRGDLGAGLRLLKGMGEGRRMMIHGRGGRVPGALGGKLSSWFSQGTQEGHGHFFKRSGGPWSFSRDVRESSGCLKAKTATSSASH